MKRGIVVVIVIVAMGAMLLFAMQGRDKTPAAAGKQETTTSQPAGKSGPDTFDERVAAIKAETTEKYGENIEWLDSSRTDFEEERQLLRKHFAEEFDKAEAATKQRVILEIAKVDLNGDGWPELVWRIFHIFYHGLGTSGKLGISYHDENGRLVHVQHFPVTWTPIAIRSTDASPWKELIVGLKLYRWDGKHYSYVEEPLETRDSDGRYTVTVYDDGKNILDKFRKLVEPKVSFVNEEILRASVIYDNRIEPTVEYFDRKNKRMSRHYEIVLADRNDRVAYLTEDNRLVIRNMFNEKVYYKEVKRDFAPLPKEERRKAVLKVEWERPDVIVVQYLAGPERRVVTEEIVLD